MKTYLIAKDNNDNPRVFEEYCNIEEGKKKFRRDCTDNFDFGYAKAFTFKLVKAKNAANAERNYFTSRNYMRKKGSEPGEVF